MFVRVKVLQKYHWMPLFRGSLGNKVMQSPRRRRGTKNIKTKKKKELLLSKISKQ